MISIRLVRCIAIVAVSLSLFSTGCLFRSRKVENRVSSAALQTATQDQLIARLNEEASKIRTMNATVDIRAAVGGQKKGKVTEYQEIRGYILAEKPALLRMVGLFPVVRNRAFDMVSDGETFKLSVPTKNRFIVGRNDVIRPNPSQPLENLRPQHIYDALLFREVDPKTELAVLEGGQEDVIDQKSKKHVEQANYVLNVVHRNGEGWFLSRKVFFDRVKLEPYRQIVYDKQGNIATVASYANFTDYNGVRFPNLIEIQRPQEEYSIGLSMVKLTLNSPLKPDQFELPQPPGSQLVRLDQTTGQAADGH